MDWSREIVLLSGNFRSRSGKYKKVLETDEFFGAAEKLFQNTQTFPQLHTPHFNWLTMVKLEHLPIIPERYFRSHPRVFIVWENSIETLKKRNSSKSVWWFKTPCFLRCGWSIFCLKFQNLTTEQQKLFIQWRQLSTILKNLFKHIPRHIYYFPKFF